MMAVIFGTPILAAIWGFNIGGIGGAILFGALGFVLGGLGALALTVILTPEFLGAMIGIGIVIGIIAAAIMLWNVGKS
jgi:hypothetical protein